MSHIDQGPLSHYNSLVDSNLSGYFTSTRMRRHLIKAGLISRDGHIVSENTYRLNMCRKEHKQHVKEMLAQAIVHKTLDLERMRQAEIRKKLEEIAKIELVRRVRMSRQRKRDTDILPYISPRSESRKRVKSKPSSSDSYKNRSTSAPSKHKTRPVSSLSSNYDEDDEDEVEYLDDNGQPIGRHSARSRESLDTRQLYGLDSAALRRYAMEVAKLNQRNPHESPYLIPQVPLPPKSPRSERMPRSSRRYRNALEQSNGSSPKRPYTANHTYLHPASPTRRHIPYQPVNSSCLVELKYLGSKLHLVREQFDKRQEVLVEQQHCGGNTLIVFKDKLEPGQIFSFNSHRHRGYPFALTIYIDGKADCRVSTCCEYRHQGYKLFGKNGHFTFSKVSNASPCYKCRLEKSQKKKGTKTQAVKAKKKSEKEDEGFDEVDQGQEEQHMSPKQEKEDEKKNHPIIPVERDVKASSTYDDDDFESSSQSSHSSRSRSSSRSSSRSHSRSRSSSRSSRSGSEEEAPKQEVQQQSPKIENAKKVDKDQRKKEVVKKTVQEVKTKDEVSSKPLSMKYSDTSDSSSEASDTEEKSKQTSKRSVAAPQIVEVKHDESDNEGKGSPVLVKKSTSLTESTSSVSGSSDSSSSSSSEDSDSEHSGSTKSPREATPVKKLNEDSETKKEKEQRVTEPVTFTFEHTTGEKKVETKDSQASAFHSPRAHDTQIENESRLKYIEEDKPSTSTTQRATSPEVKAEDVRQERRSSTASTASTTSASSSTNSSSGSFSSSSSSSSEDLKSENQTPRSKEDGNPPQEEPVMESSQAKNLYEFGEKIKIKETEDTSKMGEKIDVTVAIETVPLPEMKGDDPVQRRNSDASISSLASSSSSSVSSSSTEGSLVIKDEGGSLVLEDEKVLLVQEDGGDVKITEGDAGVKQSDQTNHRREIENIDEIQESLSESGSKESQILDNSEKPRDDIELVNVPSIQRVVAPITMTDNEINEIEETNESEDSSSSSSSDSESDSSSRSESSGSQKGSRPGSSASNKSNEEKNKLKLALSPVITIQHADTYSSKPSESLEQTNSSPAPHEAPQLPTNSHVHDAQFDKEAEPKQREVDETSQILINHTNEDSMTSDSQNNAPVHLVRSHPPEPREGSILYELEKGHQIVDIKNIKLNKLQVQEAVDFLKAKQSMSQLSLINCDLDDQDIQTLKDAVIASPSKPVVLNLSENLLTSACVPHILDLVKRKPSIEAVLLTGSNLGDNGVKQLVDGLLEQYKDSFQIDGKDLQSGEVGSKGLCELDLANCNIGDEGIEALGSLIRSGMAIDTLNLSLNTAVTQKGWVSFAQALSKAKVLETLALDNNDIGNEGLEEIARSLYDNSSLAALDLNNIHITDKGGKYLVELLKRNTFILEINLQENSLSNQLIEDINKYISLNKSINKD